MVDERDRSDAALDRLITEALDVDVAPEFVASVRARATVEPMRAPVGPLAWGLATAVALGVIMTSSVPPGDVVWIDEPAANATIIEAPSSVPTIETPVLAPPAAPAPVTVTAQRRAPSSREITFDVPEVIVDAREAMALQALVTRLREGSVDPSQLPAPRAEAGAAMSPDILIQPITVAPLAFAADLQLEVAPDRPQDVDHPQGLEGLE